VAVDAALEKGQFVVYPLPSDHTSLAKGVTHVVAGPMTSEATRGVVLLGFPNEPDLSTETRRLLAALFLNASLVVDRFRSRHDAQREIAHRDLISDVSKIAVAEDSSEHAFAMAVRRIRAAFGLSTVAVYAGQPLTLRLKYGGLPTPSGAEVSGGLPCLALREQRALLSSDVHSDERCVQLPWVADSVRSEICVPITFRNRRIGVLDLYSPRAGAFDDTDLRTLSTIARQLALIIVQDRVGQQEERRHQLETAYQRLQEFSELKEQILQNVSHELRTPLTLIKGYLELVIGEELGPLSPEQRQSLQTVLRKADDVVMIVEQIVALSPITRLSLEHERISVKELLEGVVELFERQIRGTGISIDLRPVPSELCLYGDPEKIRQVCYNILDNSVKFSPKGGHIGVEARSEDAYAHLIFRDEGIGIPQRKLSQIFDTFYQVDGSSTRRFGGLGLGLAVVSRVVKAHEGKVWAESEVDKGSTFHVLLPKHIVRNEMLDPTAVDL
jgi:signal transduction histidine kinase